MGEFTLNKWPSLTFFFYICTLLVLFFTCVNLVALLFIRRTWGLEEKRNYRANESCNNVISGSNWMT